MRKNSSRLKTTWLKLNWPVLSGFFQFFGCTSRYDFH